VRVDTFLDRSARAHPGKTALVFGQRRLTYAEVAQASDRLAAALVSMGVRRGDRVAVYLENSPEAVIAVFGALKADAVFVMVNPTTKPEKLVAVMNDCTATAMITDARRLPMTAAARAGVRSLRGAIVTGIPEDVVATGVARLETIVADSTAAVPERRAIDLDLAALIYTSGSSGRPKGVMLSHRNMVTAATSITTYLENRPSDIILNVLPLSFDYGLYQVLMAFQFGGTVVLERSFTYMHAVLETLARERVTGFPLVPTIAALLLQLDLSQYDFSSLRYVTNTGAALPQGHIAELRRLLPHARVYSMYGLTECKRVSYLHPRDLDTRPTSVGRGMPNEEVYIVDNDGKRLASGTGELVIRGSHVMQGYWGRPDDTARVLKPGPFPGEHVLHSGDLFRMDEEGYLYFIARKDNIIKSRGEKVSPKEVEDVLYRHNDVGEAAVVGVPDPLLGQAVKAIVTLKPGAQTTDRDIYRHCCLYLEDFMVPHIVEIRSSMPKTAHGKIDLRALASAPAVLNASADCAPSAQLAG
jgi:long-chain acyl-CoA synthetase